MSDQQQQITDEEARAEVIRRCSTLLQNRRSNQVVVQEEETSSDGEMSDPGGPDEVVDHAVSYKRLEKETKELNTVRKGDKQALIDYMESLGVTEKSLGQFLIKLRKKKATGISRKQVKELLPPGEPLNTILRYIDGKITTELKVTRRRRSKKEITPAV